MKIILQGKNNYVLRFDAGEELIKELADFCLKEKINAGSLSGIGSAQNIIIAYYNLDTKQYEDATVERRLEIISLSGNIALLNDVPRKTSSRGKPYAHIHGTFSDADMQPISGHVKKLIVSATCEIVLIKLEGEMRRAYDPKTGLNLLS